MMGYVQTSCDVDLAILCGARSWSSHADYVCRLVGCMINQGPLEMSGWIGCTHQDWVVCCGTGQVYVGLGLDETDQLG